LTDLLIHVPCFVAGIVAYKLAELHIGSWHFIGYPITIAAVTAFFLQGPSPERGWICCLLVGLVFPQFREMPDSWLRKLCHQVARYSYGIYLTHFICIWLAFVLLAALPVGVQWAALLVSLFVFPIVLYHMIEEPMIGLAYRLSSLWALRVVHYEFELNRFEWKKVYAQLFEFVHFFHLKHFDEEIHAHIAHDHWPTEARLMRYFKKNFVIYNGVEMSKEGPAEIIAAQRLTQLDFGGICYERIRYVEERGWLEVNLHFAEIPCHDCGVVSGQLHLDGCDVEECLRCRRQLLGCDCWTLKGG
jgi:hypothetical protein